MTVFSLVDEEVERAHPCQGARRTNSQGNPETKDLMGQERLVVSFLRQDLSIVAQAGLKLLILLSQPPKFWNYKCEPPCPDFRRNY
jgi:hypothetical protein